MKAAAVDFLPPEGTARLETLGMRIAASRKRRSLSQEDMAKQALMSLSTYRKVEKGDASVAIGNYVATLVVLGLGETLDAVAAPESDPLTTQHTIVSTGRVRRKSGSRHSDNDF